MLIKMISSGPGDPPLGDQELPDDFALELIEAGKAIAISEAEAEPHLLGHQGRRVRGEGWA